MPLSERQRDPNYKKWKRKKGGSIYGYGPKLSFPSGTAGSSGGGFPQSGGGGVPGTPAPPNIDQILANNPFYQATKGQLTAQGIADKASRDAAMRRAVIEFGFIPDLAPGALDPATLKALSHVVDPTTRELARKNTEAGLSIWARLQDALSQTQKRVVDSLGARGMFRSGETGYGLGRAQLQADQERSDAMMRTLDYLAGVQSAFTQSERQRIADENAAAQNAAQNWTGDYHPRTADLGPQPPPGGVMHWRGRKFQVPAS